MAGKKPGFASSEILIPALSPILCSYCDFAPFDFFAPFLGFLINNKIDKFQQSRFGSKSTFCFGDFSDASVQTFDWISGIHDGSNGLRVFVKSCQAFPIVAPRFDDGRILFAPFFFQFIHSLAGLCFVNCGVNRLEVFGKCAQVFVGNKLEGVSDLMHDTALNLGFWERSPEWLLQNLSSHQQTQSADLQPRAVADRSTPEAKI